jgi:phosphatidate cytidylyltransferase
MLKARIATAVPLALMFVGLVLYAQALALALIFGVFVLMGAWEWTRLSSIESLWVRTGFLLLIAASLALGNAELQLLDQVQRLNVQSLMGAACLAWAVALLWIKGYPSSAILWRSRAMRLIMGYLMLVPAWIAVMFLLSVSLGPTILICLVAIVAVADVGAYFAGRFLGKHKLAPSVSPGKTWEGFWGGFFASTAFGVLVWWLRPVELSHLNLSAVLAITLTTSLASVVGDLMVSMVKRESGYKDSGNLLPGHGGVLDRLDSICGAAPIFALGYMLAHW